MKIVLISCVKRKKPIISKAKDLYMGPLFKYSLCVAKKLKPDKIFILSAKYYLLELEKDIEPYDLTLLNFSEKQKNDWGKTVIQQLSQVAGLNTDNFIILAGSEYIAPMASHISNLENLLGNRNYGQRTSYLKSICIKND